MTNDSNASPEGTSGRRAHGAVAAAVRRILAESGPLRPADVAARLPPGLSGAGVAVTLRRLVEAGRARREGGLYAVADGERPVASGRDVRAAALAHRPGAFVTAGALAAECGATYGIAAAALTGLIREGAYRRTARGVFRRSGDGDEGEAPALPLTEAVRRLMALRGGPWHHSELRDLLEGRYPALREGPDAGVRVLWTLHNMARRGDVVRCGPGNFRAAEPVARAA